MMKRLEDKIQEDVKKEIKADKLYEFESVIKREERIKKIALEVLDTCKGKDMSLNEFLRVMEMMKIIVFNESRI